MLQSEFDAAVTRDLRAMVAKHTPPPVVAKARDDGNLGLLVALFSKAHDIEEERVWSLLECAYSAGKVDGFDRAITTIRAAQAQVESEQAELRG